MASVMTRVKNSISSSAASSMTPSARSRRQSLKGADRVIPPEPVQQQPDPELTSAEAGPALQAHNLARADKMSPKLEWDDRLARDAQTYAKTLASTGVLEHSGNEVQGENLYVTTSEDAKYEDAVVGWMKEETSYNNEIIGQGDLSQYGHFSKPARNLELESLVNECYSTSSMAQHNARWYGKGKVAGRQDVYCCSILSTRKH
jgi:hypothetical protein